MNGVTRFPPSVEHRKVLFVSLPRLPASHKRCKVAWFGDAGGSETIETIPNIILIRIIPTIHSRDTILRV